MLVLAIFSSEALSKKSVFIRLQDNLFVKAPVPKRGIVCSNQDRIFRLQKILKDTKHFKTSWGTNLFIGTYKGEPFFIVNAPVGSGSGLVFTELFSAGAEYVVRFGSDDVKSPKKYEYQMIKIIDETDNLFGFNKASGVDPKEWGKSVFASPFLLELFTQVAKESGFRVEKRVCHHLENYHSLRTPEKFSPERTKRLKQELASLSRKDKKESFDMESAVLFRVAKDFDLHAISVLQTVDKETRTGPYSGKNKVMALEQERKIVLFILDTLLKIKTE